MDFPGIEQIPPPFGRDSPGMEPYSLFFVVDVGEQSDSARTSAQGGIILVLV